MRSLSVVLSGAMLLAAAMPVASPQEPATPAVRFAGTWVGTQAWDIANPPPGSRQDQPVSLTIDVKDGTITGNLKPFLGADEGATFVDARIVGDELRANAAMGRGGRGGRGGGGGWRGDVAVSFVFRVDDLNLTGTADVKLGDVPWMKFKYDLSKKRSRY